MPKHRGKRKRSRCRSGRERDAWRYSAKLFLAFCLCCDGYGAGANALSALLATFAYIQSGATIFVALSILMLATCVTSCVHAFLKAIDSLKELSRPGLRHDSRERKKRGKRKPAIKSGAPTRLPRSKKNV